MVEIEISERMAVKNQIFLKMQDIFRLQNHDDINKVIQPQREILEPVALATFLAEIAFFHWSEHDHGKLSRPLLDESKQLFNIHRCLIHDAKDIAFCAMVNILLARVDSDEQGFESCSEFLKEMFEQHSKNDQNVVVGDSLDPFDMTIGDIIVHYWHMCHMTHAFMLHQLGKDDLQKGQEAIAVFRLCSTKEDEDPYHWDDVLVPSSNYRFYMHQRCGGQVSW